jgi:ABC-type molybdate transport system substrate-binding protein
VELVGPLPPDLQASVTFVAGVASRSNAPEAGRQLIAFLLGPKAVDVHAQGMEPPR